MPPRAPIPRLTNPAIIPIAPRTFGNNVPKSLHKTRRSWWPNVTRANLTVNILDGLPLKTSIKGKEKEVLGNGTVQQVQAQALRGVKIAVRDLKDVDKAGGVEGLLLSRPAKDFTPYGQKLRAELFKRLHDQRDQAMFQQMTRTASGTGRVTGSSGAGSVGGGERI